MPTPVFVYGTLKRGLSNSHYLSGQRFISEACTQPNFRLVDCGGYPGMFAVSENGLSIVGEIWEVADECLARLDLLEDTVGGEYERVLIPLLPPYENASIQGYLFKRDISRYRVIGDNWTDTVITQAGLAARGERHHG